MEHENQQPITKMVNAEKSTYLKYEGIGETKPISLKQATGYNADDNIGLSAFAEAKKEDPESKEAEKEKAKREDAGRRMADFDDPNGHSFSLINEFLQKEFEPALFFAEGTLIDQLQTSSACVLKNEGGVGSGQRSTFALAFTRRWTDEHRPEGVKDNNGTLIVIAIRHRVAHNEFTMQLMCNQEVLSFGGLNRFHYATMADEKVLNLALAINISDGELTRALQGAQSADKVQPGRDFISLIAKCTWKCKDTTDSEEVVRFVRTDLPPSVENMPVPFTVGALDKDWKTLLSLGPRPKPITVGFEFEDGSLTFTNVENAHEHVAKVRDLELEGTGLIVGADIVSGGKGKVDLEVRSAPFDLFDDDSISKFMDLYKKLYRKPSAIEGLTVLKEVPVGKGVQPQVTVSIPFDRVASFIKNAPLVWSEWEESALRIFMSIKSPKLASIDTSDQAIVCEMGEFLAFYLARVWMHVACPPYSVQYGGNVDKLREMELDLAYKTLHSVYVKDVNRNDVKINGVVDLYYHLRKKLTRKSEFHTALTDMLNTAAASFLPYAEAVVERREISKDKGISFMPRTRQWSFKSLNSIKSVEDFNAAYLKYLETEAIEIAEKQSKYTPGKFNFNVDTSSLRTQFKQTVFTSLTGTGVNMITPVKGQDHCAYFEERRLASCLSSPDPNDDYSLIPSKRMVVRLLLELQKLKAELDEKPDTSAYLDLRIKGVLIMVQYYRRFLLEGLSV